MQIVKIAHSAKLGRAPGDQAPPHQGGPRLSQRARDTCNGIVDDRCFNPSYTPDVDKHCMQNDKALILYLHIQTWKLLLRIPWYM